MSETRERLTAAQIKAELLATALAVGTGEAEEPAKPKAKAKPPVEQAAAEVLAQPRSAPVVSEADLEASAARGKAVIDSANRFLTRGPDRERMRRESIESYYQTKFGPEQKSEDSASAPAGKNFAELVKGLTSEERDALATEIYEADAADDELVKALGSKDEIPQPQDWTDEERESYRQFMLDNHGVDVAYDDELGEGETEDDYESETNASSELD